jgi:DNA primase
MYIIAPQFIRDYITQNFSDKGRLSSNGQEFIMESLFVQNDWKKHMSVNVDSGLWQCFKTGRSGNFVRLYSEAEEIPYFRAYRDLMIRNFEFLGEDIPEQVKEERQLELDTSNLIPLNIESGFSDDPSVLAAWSLLFERKLFTEDDPPEAEYYLCKEGKFANRIIIPFKKEGIVYYFQGRALGDQQPKYLNPSTEIAPNPSEILYPYDEEADHLVVCEGPLDAKSLQLQGVNATATMKNYISPRQAEILSTFNGRVIIGFDNDEAGLRGCQHFDQLRRERLMEDFWVCAPPFTFKDWNEAHQKQVSLPAWIERESSLYNFEYKMLNEISSL